MKVNYSSITRRSSQIGKAQEMTNGVCVCVLSDVQKLRRTEIAAILNFVHFLKLSSLLLTTSESYMTIENVTIV